ncbi:MAG: phenylacetic acid degradation protein [Armatimonadetes bacterium]|nr:phenylacetic acid degradation protein [Armatimonadota bacterium]
MQYMLLAACALLLSAEDGRSQPLMDYLARPDSSFAWHVSGEKRLPGGGSVVEVEMISQVWQGIPWKHRLGIVRPSQMGKRVVPLLLITGNYDQGEMVGFLAQAANAIGAPVAVLYDIPNQPLYNGLEEDALISYTFVKYLETKDASWPLLFPMVKGAVRAMDVLQQLARQWGAEATGFVVTGASKRGWTTWLTGASDRRVRGIAPMVYDNLDLAAQMKHQVDTWGSYSSQISDYTEKGLPQMLQAQEGQELSRMVDPFTFRSRIRVPKLIINGTNDPYWTLDAANLYYDKLVGPRYILYVPNAGHGLEDRGRVLGSLRAFHAACSGKTPLPRLTWKYRPTEKGIELAAQSSPRPAEVVAWVATSEDKDFRDARWEKKPLTEERGRYLFTLDKPSRGYAAVIGEAAYGAGFLRFHLSTQVQIIGGPS